MNIIVKLEGVDTTLGELQHALEQFDSSEDARLRAKRDSLVKLGGGIRSKLEDVEAQIEDKQGKLDRIHSKKKPDSISVRHRRTAATAEVLEHLESLFNRSLHRLRDALRETVQDQATAAFLAMTTDKTYKGLRINDQYGLSIIDDLGHEVPLRSAGAEQVVALSLIMALNASRVRNAVVMDTPFGRLDPHHRRNILEALPELARQVVLLVHEGELTRDETPAHLGAALTRSYAIHHHSSFHSELRSEELGVGT